jgi:hypothetical protein
MLSAAHILENKHKYKQTNKQTHTHTFIFSGQRKKHLPVMLTPQKIRSKDRRTKAPKEDRMAVCRVHRTNKSQGREEEDSLG